MMRPVERRPDELGHARVQHDQPRVGPLAHVEHRGDEPAGARDEEPSGLHRPAPRPAVRSGCPRGAPAARGRTARARGRSSRSPRPGSRRRHRACRRPAARHARARPARAPRRTASRQASIAPELRADVEVDPRAAGSPRLAAARSTVSVSSVSVIPNFEAPAPTASPAWVSGVDVRVECGRARRAGRSPAPPRPGRRPRRAHQTRQLVRRLDGDPRERAPRPARARTAAPRSRVGLADALQRDRGIQRPARRAIAHSPAETTFAPSPRPAEPGDDRRARRSP